eukprot:2691520-Ditylum_brightwellii.AAC.1
MVLAPTPTWTTSGHMQGCGVAPMQDDDPSYLIYLCGQCYTQYGGPMWCWLPAQIGPHQVTYEVVVSMV